jgi:hypothetical protein
MTKSRSLGSLCVRRRSRVISAKSTFKVGTFALLRGLRWHAAWPACLGLRTWVLERVWTRRRLGSAFHPDRVRRADGVAVEGESPRLRPESVIRDRIWSHSVEAGACPPTSSGSGEEGVPAVGGGPSRSSHGVTGAPGGHQGVQRPSPLSERPQLGHIGPEVITRSGVAGRTWVQDPCAGQLPGGRADPAQLGVGVNTGAAGEGGHLCSYTQGGRVGKYPRGVVVVKFGLPGQLPAGYGLDGLNQHAPRPVGGGRPFLLGKPVNLAPFIGSQADGQHPAPGLIGRERWTSGTAFPAAHHAALIGIAASRSRPMSHISFCTPAAIAGVVRRV